MYEKRPMPFGVRLVSWLNNEYTSKELFSMYFSFREQSEQLKEIPFHSWRVDKGTVIDPKQDKTLLFLRKAKAIRHVEETDNWEAEPSFFQFINTADNYNFWTLTFDSTSPDQCLHSYSTVEPAIGSHLTIREINKGNEYKYRVLGTTNYQLYRSMFERIYDSPITWNSVGSEWYPNNSEFWEAWLLAYPETFQWVSHVYPKQKLMGLTGNHQNPGLLSQFQNSDSWIAQFEIFSPFSGGENRVVKWKVAIKLNDQVNGYFGSDQE
jgi:hypothetical protein